LHKSFNDFFQAATGLKNFAFQEKFARELPSLVSVPTGLGKTAMVVIGWLWRRFGGDEALRKDTPRRLVYCLPMRVLVEQTRDCVLDWLDAMGLLAGSVERSLSRESGRRGRIKGNTYKWDRGAAAGRVSVHVLMGGEDEDDWDIFPEHDAIIIGTQDMLLSRALNRGYAAARARWPMQFGLLHTDCLWVFDEIQLMGAGLATSAQLEAFRRILPTKNAPIATNGHGCRSVWMSATMQRDWLNTVDFEPFLKDATQLTFDVEEELKADGLGENSRQAILDRWKAARPLTKAGASSADPGRLATEILAAHKPGTRTIVVLNTVERACTLFKALDAVTSAGRRRSRSRCTPADVELAPEAKPTLVLLHSRFRPAERQLAIESALGAPPPGGTIIVSTQVIEAGVDVSATTLFTELAPWASLVQRFGRCNRRGEANQAAQVFWIDLLSKHAAPYPAEVLDEARNRLQAFGKRPEHERDVGLQRLPAVNLEFEHKEVIRRRDFIDLFDTTPDLAGNDIDIDRFVREIETSDVRVFWRSWNSKAPPKDKEWRKVDRGELCPVPVEQLHRFASQRDRSVWRWDQLGGHWVRPEVIYPGQVYLIHAEEKDGLLLTPGYDPRYGWGISHAGAVPPVATSLQAQPRDDDEYDDEGLSITGSFQSIAEHTDHVCTQLASILPKVDVSPREAHLLCLSARWHDLGKSHEAFQIKISDGELFTDKEPRPKRDGRWKEWAGCRDVAKAPKGFWTLHGKADHGFRRCFRHELASALAVLQRPHEELGVEQLADDELNLVAYLVAAHHGKVRLSIRSLPNEGRPRKPDGKPADNKRFARGVWDDDPLPETVLGHAADGSPIKAPPLRLSLEPMEIGLCQAPPFAGQPSWAERMIRLRDTIGPFRLAYLEAILRAADARGSMLAETQDLVAGPPAGIGTNGEDPQHE